MEDLFNKKETVEIGFEDEIIDLPLDLILPIKPNNKHVFKGKKFNQILSSIKEVGIIEPVVVSPESGGKYILLDGHLRIIALQKIGIETVSCLISKDDEAYTYNKYINRLSPIQEHKMIKKAISKGVAPEKIAKALNIEVGSILKKKNMLNGICEEAVNILKDKMVSAGVFEVLRKMLPIRQIEVATMMNDSATYTLPYAKAFLAATTKDMLTNPDRAKKIRGLDEEQLARMESEMASLQREYKLIEENYTNDVLTLTLAKGYIDSIINNAAVVRYLSKNNPEILSEFQKITEIQSLG